MGLLMIIINMHLAVGLNVICDPFYSTNSTGTDVYMQYYNDILNEQSPGELSTAALMLTQQRISQQHVRNMHQNLWNSKWVDFDALAIEVMVGTRAPLSISKAHLDSVISDMETWPSTLEMMRTKVAVDVVNLKNHLAMFSLHENAFGPHHAKLGALLAKWREAFRKLTGKS